MRLAQIMALLGLMKDLVLVVSLEGCNVTQATSSITSASKTKYGNIF